MLWCLGALSPKSPEPKCILFWNLSIDTHSILDNDRDMEGNTMSSEKLNTPPIKLPIRQIKSYPTPIRIIRSTPIGQHLHQVLQGQTRRGRVRIGLAILALLSIIPYGLMVTPESRLIWGTLLWALLLPPLVRELRTLLHRLQTV